MRIANRRRRLAETATGWLARFLALGLSCCLSAAAAAGTSDAQPDRAKTPLAQIPGAPATPPQPAAADEQPEVQAHYDRARELIADQQYARAVGEIDAALKLARGDRYDLLYLLAQTKLSLGRLGEARVAAELATVFRPHAADAHYLLGVIARQLGRFDEALPHFRSVTLAEKPPQQTAQTTLAWYDLGECLAQSGYLLAAAEAFEQFDLRVWQAHPEDRASPEVAAVLGQQPYGLLERRLSLLRELGDADRQAAAVRAALQARPDEVYVQRIYMTTLVQVGQAAQAYEFGRKRLEASEEAAAESRPAWGGGWPLLGVTIEAARAAGQWDRWSADLCAAVGQGHFVSLTAEIARRLTDSGEYRAAQPLWRALLDARPESMDRAWDLAGVLQASGDLSGALDVVIAQIRRSAGMVELPDERLRPWLADYPKTDEFLRLVTQRAAAADADGATHLVLGVAAEAAGQTELAERLFQRARELSPELLAVDVAWGRLLVRAFRWEDAKSRLEEALKQRPDWPAALRLLAEAHAGLDEDEAAERFFKSALSADSGDVAAAMGLARQYRRVGNLLGAQRYFQQAWSLDHRQTEALEELVEAYLEGGKLELARGLLKEAESADVPADVLRRVRTTLRFAATPLSPEHLGELQRQWDESPDDGRTGLKLAAGLYIHDQPERAARVLDGLVVSGPAAEQAAFLRGRVHLRLLEAERAVSVLEEQARRYPRRFAVLALLTEACLADFRPAEARETLQRMLALDLPAKQRDEQRRQLLATYLDFMEYDGALDWLDKWLKEAPESEDWVRAKLRVLLLADRSGEALELASKRLAASTACLEDLRQRQVSLAERLRENPEDSEAVALQMSLAREMEAAREAQGARRAELVQVCMDAREFARVEAEVRGWLAAEPGESQYQEWLIEILLESGKPEEAMQIVGQVSPREATEVLAAMIWRARCEAAAGRLSAAVDDLSGLLDDPAVKSAAGARIQIRQELLKALTEAREYSRALQFCDRWLNEAGDDRAGQLEALTFKRLALAASGQDTELAAVTERLLEINPADPMLNNDLGYTWVERGINLDRAVELIRRAVASEPLTAPYLDSLGWAYYKLGDYPAAQRYLSRAARLREGQDATIFDHLGDAEYRLGDTVAARHCWEHAVTLLDPEKDERGPREARDAERLAGLRAKLAALARGDSPELAPVAAPASAESRPALENHP